MLVYICTVSKSEIHPSVGLALACVLCMHVCLPADLTDLSQSVYSMPLLIQFNIITNYLTINDMIVEFNHRQYFDTILN